MKKSLIFGASIISLSLAACGTQQPAPLNLYGVSKGAGSVGVHTVKSGDTVYKIAENYQIPMREIITLNNIEAPYVLDAGYRMKLPPPNEHTVKKYDNVYSVARMYETSVNRLVELNDLTPPYALTAGQKLRLPTPTIKAQQAKYQEIERANKEAAASQNARIAPVAREAIYDQASPQQTQQDNPSSNNAVAVPSTKPTVKKVSTARAKIPKTTPRMSGNGKFMQPVNGRVVSSFGPKSGGLHNDGINIKAARGTAVRAAENGVVVYVGDELESYGNLILVRHGKGMMSAYAHLDKTLVTRGAKIKRGQSIGTVGSTGQVDSPQLHFEIRKGSTPVNPDKHL